MRDIRQQRALITSNWCNSLKFSVANLCENPEEWWWCSHPQNTSVCLIGGGNPVKFNLTLTWCVTNCFSTFLLKYFTAVLSVLSTPYLLTPYRSVGGVIASSGFGCAEVWIRMRLNYPVMCSSSWRFTVSLYQAGCGPCFIVPRCYESLACVVILLEHKTAEEH